jgi:hypothetical protein
MKILMPPLACGQENGSELESSSAPRLPAATQHNVWVVTNKRFDRHARAARATMKRVLLFVPACI